MASNQILPTWNNRPKEVQALFNPAFCGLVISEAIRAYRKQRNEPLPLELAFVILPIVLSSNMRSTFPSTSRQSLISWSLKNSLLLIDVQNTHDGMKLYSSEAIRFGILAKLFSIDSACKLSPSAKRPFGFREVESSNPDLFECIKCAKILGKWLGEAPDASFVFQALRIVL